MPTSNPPEPQRTFADGQKRRALQRWENEGGSIERARTATAGRGSLNASELSGAAEALRDARMRILQAIVPREPANVVRGQFRGYRHEKGGAPDSRVETFAAVRLSINSWRWAGVPFYIRAGKQLSLTCTEVLVEFKRPHRSVFGEAPPDRGDANHLRFRLSPDVRIALGVRSKVSEETMKGRDLELLAARADPDEMEPYERLLGDAMKGDATLFTRADTGAAEWRVVEGILGDAAPVSTYEPGTWGPAEADRIIEGPWHDPERALQGREALGPSRAGA